jgi:Asp-tRNA(Asn)/Glu-tRNA(Gln) amidotransferase A subunit family amidase
MPVGLQAMSAHWNEHTLLRLAAAAEELMPTRRPHLWYDILGTENVVADEK